jgi:hypothetical protein
MKYDITQLFIETNQLLLKTPKPVVSISFKNESIIMDPNKLHQYIQERLESQQFKSEHYSSSPIVITQNETNTKEEYTI